MAREPIYIPPGKLWKQTTDIENQMSFWTYGCKAVIKPGTKIIFVGGAVPMDADRNIVGLSDLKAQYKQCMENIKVVLEAEGATLKDVVQLNNYTTDEAAFMRFGDYRCKMWPELFGKPGDQTGPAGIAVGVTRICHPDQMIEIEAIAVVDPK